MRVLIIGGGIGGQVAAMALQQVGIEALVYEAQRGPASSLGLFLGLGVNGMRVLRQLNALDSVLRADTVPTPVMVFSNSGGKRIGAVSNGQLDTHTPSISIMRGALQTALADEAQARGVAIRYDKRLKTFVERGDHVVAHFEDGSTAEGAVLIGADGIRSRVRAAMLPDASGPSYTGLLNIGGVAHQSGLPATPGEMHMVWGKRAFFGYTIRPGGEAWWFANVGMAQEPSRQELAALSAQHWRQTLQALFAEDAAFITALIQQTQSIGVTPIHDMPSLPRWSCGRAALLGDAAHAVSPSAGQGASMAMEDALMLARCLRDDPEPRRALRRYEELRRPRAERIVATGRRRGSYKAPESGVALFLRDLLMPLAFRLFASERSLAWIYDYEIPWIEPVSPATRSC